MNPSDFLDTKWKAIKKKLLFLIRALYFGLNVEAKLRILNVISIKGVRVQIGSAQPRMKQNQDHGGHGGGHTGGHYGGRGNYGYAPDPLQSGSQG